MGVAWSPRGRRINWVGLDPRSFVPADGLPLQPNGQLGRGQHIETMAVPHLAVELQRQTLGGLYDGVLDPLLKTSILGPLLLPGWADAESGAKLSASNSSISSADSCARRDDCESHASADLMLPTCGASSASVGSMHTGDAIHRAASTVASSVVELGVGLDPVRAVQRFCLSFARANSSSLSVPCSMGRRPLERAHRFQQCSKAVTHLVQETVPNIASTRWSAWLPVPPSTEAQANWHLLPLAGSVVERSEDTSAIVLARLRNVCTNATISLLNCSALRQSAITAVNALLSVSPPPETSA